MSRSTRELLERPMCFVYGTVTLFGCSFQRPSTTHRFCNSLGYPKAAPQPRTYCYVWFRLFPFRSPLLRESRLISFPPATEMFQFAGFAPHTYGFSVRYLLRGGFPHSEIAGSQVVCHLTDAYRRLPRLSSPSTAKASTMCAYSLDHITPRSLRGYFNNI